MDEILLLFGDGWLFLDLQFVLVLDLAFEHLGFELGLLGFLVDGSELFFSELFGSLFGNVWGLYFVFDGLDLGVIDKDLLELVLFVEILVFEFM